MDSVICYDNRLAEFVLCFGFVGSMISNRLVINFFLYWALISICDLFLWDLWCLWWVITTVCWAGTLQILNLFLFSDICLAMLFPVMLGQNFWLWPHHFSDMWTSWCCWAETCFCLMMIFLWFSDMLLLRIGLKFFYSEFVFLCWTMMLYWTWKCTFVLLTMMKFWVCFP